MSAPGRSARDRGFRFEIDDDAELAQAELTKSDGDAYESSDIVLTAPRVVGEHVYRAVVVAADKDGALHEQPRPKSVSTSSRMRRQLNVWDVPPAIVAGERFKVIGRRQMLGWVLT